MTKNLVRGCTAATLVAILAGCSGSDPISPSAVATPQAPRALVADGELYGFYSDSVDAYGNTTLIQEIAAGTYTLSDGSPTAAGSVTIRTFIPAFSGSSSSCITSTILRTEATAGNTLTVKKAGGCDKSIEVAIEQKATKRKATFSFLYKAGKTVIDIGTLR